MLLSAPSPPTDTYDVYVATNGVVKIVDFNPAGGTTSALLFTWEELEEAEAEQGAAHDANAAPPPPSPPMGGVVGGDGAAAPPHQDGAHQHSGRLWRPSQQVLVRIVDDASLVQPGEKAACGMPFDMLMLQDRGAVQDMIDFMHRQPS